MARDPQLALRPARLALAVATVCFVCLAAATGSTATGASVSFSPGLPAKVFEGQKASFYVVVHPAARSCRLTVRYKGGRTDTRGQPVLHGRASWTIRIPAVPPGPASLTVVCKGAGTTTGTILVQWALQAPQLTIGKRGYSQRANVASGTSDMSYGLELHNDRVRFDAVNVSVLVNFVDATNRVLGSAIRTISRIPAATTFYVGGSQTIPTLTPTTRLEIIITAASSAQRAISVAPLVSDVVVVPNLREPYVDAVRGQLLNHYASPIQHADLGVVVLDANGDIVGGGFTGAPGPLSYGAREFFNAAGTFRAIPISRAASALVSPVPTYPAPATP